MVLVLRASVALLAAFLGLAPLPAAAQSGAQLSPDGKRVLINKDVGGERWAIARNLDDGSVTGNVFLVDGSAPLFVACEETGRSGADVTLECEGSGRCAITPCNRSEWSFIAEVTLPLSFFEATGDRSSVASEPGSVAALRGSGTIAQTENSPAGVQVGPTRLRTLINKDVGGGQRWAITLNGDDSTVTGNVFFPDGADPVFVWCNRTGTVDTDYSFRCLGADRCGSGGCSAEDWTLISELSIPGSFFDPPEQVSIEELSTALTDLLGEDGGFDAMIRALGLGYSLRQIANGAFSGQLGSSGEVTDSQTGVVTPESQPIGTPVESTTSNHLGDLPDIVPLRPSEIRQNLNDVGLSDEFTVQILLLAARGYGMQQIFEALDEGRVGVETGSFGVLGLEDHLTIVDDNGRVVPPAVLDPIQVVLPPDRPRLICGDLIVDPGESCEPGRLLGRTCETFGFDGGELACHPTLCRFDVSNCRRCGNGRIEPGESCDGDNVAAWSCLSLAEELGADVVGIDPSQNVATIPGCTSECEWDFAPCRASGATGCPNGKIDGTEQCDGLSYSKAGGFGRKCGGFLEGYIGTLGCDLVECRYDISDCRLPLAEYCGDNERNQDWEQCDGTDLPISSCADYSDAFVSGTLQCRPLSCSYDTSGCVAQEPSSSPTPTPTPTPSPTPTPTPDPGNGPTPSPTPTPTPSPTPSPTPTPQPVETPCGDGAIIPPEECEPGNLDGKTCENIDDDFIGGTLKCDGNCRFDFSDCEEDAAPTFSIGDTSIRVPLNAVSGFTLDLSFSDENKDITQICFAFASGGASDCRAFTPGSATTGTFSEQWGCGEDVEVTSLNFWLKDAEGNESNRVTVTFTCGN